MTNADALVAACDADPGNDLPRLVFADYLDDHGHPVAAEFVRVACEAARLVRRPPGELPRLNARRKEVWRRYAAEYAPQLRTAGLDERAFTRGLPARPAVCTADEFLCSAGSWWAGVPVRAVRLADVRPDHADLLADCPALQRLTDLALGFARDRSGEFGLVPSEIVPDAVVERLAAADLPRLRWLDLGLMADPVAGLRALAASPWAGRLPGDAVTVRVRTARRFADGEPWHAHDGRSLFIETPLVGRPTETVAAALTAAVARLRADPPDPGR